MQSDTSRSLSLDELNKDVKIEINKWLPDSDKSRLALASKNFYKLGLSVKTNFLFNSHIRMKCQLVQKLLRHIVYGEQAQAEAILRKDAGLLLEKSMVIDYSNRIIKGTPLKAALGAGDVNMFHMILPYFKQLHEDDKIALTQFEEQFPEGVEGKQSIYAFEALVETISAEFFIGSQISDKTKTELNKFRHDFRPSMTEERKHFNIQTFIQFLKIYVGNFPKWNGEQCLLSWQKVIGYLERLLPACDAQALCQGLYNLTELKQSLKRSLKLKDDVSYFPLDLHSNFRLGDKNAIYSGTVPLFEASYIPSPNMIRSMILRLETYAKQKCEISQYFIKNAKRPLCE